MKLGTQLRDALEALGLSGSKGAELARPGRPAETAALSHSQGVAGIGKAERPAGELAYWKDQVRRASPAPAERSAEAKGARKAARTVSTPEKMAPTAQAPAPAPPRPVTRLVRVSPFHSHPLFQPDPSEPAGLPDLPNGGIEGQLTEEPDNATDLIIGLDFGTSATKVVVRDAFAATGVFPVPLSRGLPGIDGYLLPSRVFRTGEVYSLVQGAHRITDLKLGLLACKARSPVTEFNDCCAFLALVIRRVRGWMLSEHRDVYSRHALGWRLNLGLATRSYEDAATVALFRRLAWAAANLASDRDAAAITVATVDKYRLASLDEALGKPVGRGEFAWSDVDAIPEVSAQLQGFMSSARWDWNSRPVMMLVDVGAGTVDSALFHVRAPQRGQGVLTFYSSRVELNGAMCLHRSRVEWLQAHLPKGQEHADAFEHLEAIGKPTDRLRPIPESVREYLGGYTIELVGTDVDDRFRNERYRAQIAGTINDAKVGKGIPSTQLARIPLLLCGGGSRMRYYGTISDSINGTRGWDVSVESMRLPLPPDLVESGWHADDFDRLSVAYGLSLAGNGDTTLGSIVRAIEVPDADRYQPSVRDSAFVSKDQM
ncbi:hypothetical protein OU995_27280 [Roseateles sp. SL47]|uniref:hypothetical protein n=1 Tax=Roseateles sp. SL47 TaxID=2995138 RepID=UPI00226ED05E|nr:hypothetical protein [Roseateles sp. SL47]WAC73154.1 hypothetical protein OU995_27280 [Roseateles sp. SL47]